MTTINVRFLEFGGVSLDLRHVNFPVDKRDDSQNNEYIIFLNVCKAFYANFKIVSDLSLETLCHFIYQQVEFIKNNVATDLSEINYEHFVINDNDRGKSIIIEFDDDARIIVASVIRFDEQYYQRVGGYLDFENRHNPAQQKKLSTAERAERDKKCEVKLLGYT
ncbi:ac57 [Sucra jujuba nucleopolyhedrovirus]|uniref:Ac57 n=1 Tax=Sucra jujuba nucleopolyhedrovirus TaxID=1563660 RepID=A0A097P8Y2_9ABAC|nr:ac57 [Sucra jujuba nucleopolyhedrovirus]AIU41283.1 ac57 [Sucra jujuba nucleopolyhedrovirus]